VTNRKDATIKSNRHENMQTLQIFDPAMCCSTGVCGPEVDTKLVQFAADLDWLKAQDVIVQRHNLSQDPAAFVENKGRSSHADRKRRSRVAGFLGQRQGYSNGPLSRTRELAGWFKLKATAHLRL
jgi:arsenite-transporting ATPase